MTDIMEDACCSVPEAGCVTCELPSATLQRLPRRAASCPACHQKGKPVELRTVQALLSVSLRALPHKDYLFCKTGDCPVVYFSSDGEQTFTREQVRERVYQKESGADDVWVCYCFRHTAGEVRNAPGEQARLILDDINTGIQADQCACDLRNPQGSCCLGNVRALIRSGAALQEKRQA